MGWSDRHLAREFRREIGLTPKAAARVIRFDRARRLLPRHSGAVVAAECGYADQAHLIREFVAFTGLSPTRWLAEEVGNLQVSAGAERARLGDMTDRDKTPPPQVWPTLRARDARALIRFLVDVVGFEETVVYGDGEVVHHAQLSWPLGGGIMLGLRPARATRTDGRCDPAPSARTSSWTIRTHCSNGCGPAALRSPTGLHTTDYGSRDFAIRDPEGNRWSFGTYRGEPRQPSP